LPVIGGAVAAAIVLVIAVVVVFIVVVKMKRKSCCQSLALPKNGTTAHGHNEAAGTPTVMDNVAYAHRNVVHATNRHWLNFNPLSTMPNKPPPLPPRNYLEPATGTS